MSVLDLGLSTLPVPAGALPANASVRFAFVPTDEGVGVTVQYDTPSPVAPGEINALAERLEALVAGVFATVRLVEVATPVVPEPEEPIEEPGVMFPVGAMVDVMLQDGTGTWALGGRVTFVDSNTRLVLLPGAGYATPYLLADLRAAIS